MKTLQPYRDRIDEIDAQLLKLLRARYDVIDEVGVLKLREGLAPVLQDRVDEVRDNAVEHAKALGLDEDFIRKLWTDLIGHSCDVEAKYIAKHKTKAASPK